MTKPEINILAWLNHDQTATGPIKAPGNLRQRLGLVEKLIRELPPAISGPVLVWQGENHSYLHRVVTERVVIGRSQDADVILSSTKVSRRHCEILRQEETVLTDLGSLNGTLVNGVSIGTNSAYLKSGDLIEVGPYAIFYLGQ